MSVDLRLIANGGTATEVDSAASDDTTGYFRSSAAATLDIVALPNNGAYYRYYDSGSAGTYGIGDGFTVTWNLTASGGAGQYVDMFLGFSDTADVYTSQVNSAGVKFEGVNTLAYSTALARESSVTKNGAGGAALTESITRYHRTQYLSSLGGQYGAIISQDYSDAGLATLVSNSVLACTAAPTTYRYLHHAAAGNFATAYTFTGTITDLTLLSRVPAGEDLTAYTEVDSGAYLVPYSDCLTITNIRGDIYSSLTKDKGTGYFSGGYDVSIATNWTAFTNIFAKHQILRLTNDAPTSSTNAANSTVDAHAVEIVQISSTTYCYKAVEVSGGVTYESSASSTLTEGVPAFPKLTRNMAVGTYGQLELRVYSDALLTVEIGSAVTLTLHDNGTPNFVAFRYICAFCSNPGGGTPSNLLTGTIGGISVSATTTVYATPGAFSWAGKTAALSANAITATVGAFSWAGKTSSLSAMVQATKGAFSWAGLPVNLNTGGQVNTTPGAFSWAGITSPLSTSIVTSKGAFSWAGKTSILGATVTSLRSWRIEKYDTVTSKIIPVTGLTTVKYMLYDPTTSKIMDFSDFTFKASTDCTTPQGTMSERLTYDSLGRNLTAGVYDILVSTTGLSGLYQEYAESYSTDNYFSENPVRFQDGVEYLGGLTVSEAASVTAIEQATDTLEASMAALPADIIAAATATPIAANMEQTNGIDLKGDGTAGDKFRSVLVA